MKPLLIVMSLFVTVLAFAQNPTINFEYDDSGNRTERYYAVIELRSSSLALDSSEIKTVTKAEDTAKVDKLFEEPIINSSLKDIKVVIYPNPTKGQLKVKVTGMMSGGSCRYCLCNLQGKQILKEVQKGDGESLLDLSSFPSAVYVLELSIGSKKQVYKIIKE